MNNEEKFQVILNDVSSDPERRSQAILIDVSGHSTIYEYESSRCMLPVHRSEEECLVMIYYERNHQSR